MKLSALGRYFLACWRANARRHGRTFGRKRVHADMLAFLSARQERAQ